MNHRALTNKRPRKPQPDQRRGAMLVLVAVMLVILVVMTVFSVDIAHMHLIRTELRTATDAAARAGSESLSRNQDPSKARTAAKNAATQNLVNGKPLLLDDGDMEFGAAVQTAAGQFQFRPGAIPINTIRVNGRRTTGSPSGSVPLFMGGILGTGSFQPESNATSTSIVRDIAIVVDRSGSMRGSKIDALKSAVRIFVGIMENTPADERVSLSSYSSSSRKDTPMASSFGTLRSEIDNMLAAGSTAIGAGLNDGIDSLLFDSQSREFAGKTVVLMTDGRENTGIPVLNVVPRAIAEDITVHTITFGAGANITTMQQVAARTNGTHQHATSDQELRDAFKRIADSLAVLMIE